MTYRARVDAARRYGGDTTPYETGNTLSYRKDAHGVFPASYPKFSLKNTHEGALETAFRIWLPARYLLKTNPRDKDILQNLVNNRYIDLIVENVTEQFNERVQVVNLANGKFVSYYYGQQPAQITISGRLFNDFQGDWRNSLLRVYHRYIRGSKLAARGRKVIFSYSDMVVTGEVTGMSTGLAGATETHGTFSMTVLVHRVVVKVNPITSDFKLYRKPANPQINFGGTLSSNSPNSSSSTIAAVRSSNAADRITQVTHTPQEKQRKLDALSQRQASLQANYSTAQTASATAQSALTAYQQSNPNDPNSPTALSLQDKLRAAQSDEQAVARSIQDTVTQRQQVLDGSDLRDNRIRKRSNPVPVTSSRLIVLSAAAQPKVNRNANQSNSA